MGWLSATKCGECGSTINGPKFSRTAFGAQFWLCTSCEEKRKADEARIQQQAEEARAREKEQLSEKQQAQFQDVVTNIKDRSDVDIAEALSQFLLVEYRALLADIAHLVGKEAKPKSIEAYVFVLAAVSFAFRLWKPLPIDASRHDQIEEKFNRIALARFIHHSFVNPPAELSQPLDREKLLAELMERCPAVSKVHQKNIARSMELVSQKEYKGFIAWLAGLARTQLFDLQNPNDSSFVPLTDPRSMALSQRTWLIVDRAAKGFQPFALILAALGTPANSRIALEMPESWLLRQVDPYLYYDPCTPQYNLQVSIHKTPPSSEESPASFLQRITAGSQPGVQIMEIGNTRAISQYRSDAPEAGLAKDDYHWVLAEKENGTMRSALITLSVLASRANPAATAALAATLKERIGKSRFLD